MKDKDYIMTKQMLESIEKMNKKKPLRESEEEKETSIAITNDPRFGQNVLQNQIDAFRKSVSGGAKFADENGEDAESNPLVFYPKSGNLVFTGSIPNLSGLRFQFSLNDVTNAPYIFVDGLALTEDVLTTLQRLSGHFKNWSEEWQSSTDLLDKLKKEDSKKTTF